MRGWGEVIMQGLREILGYFSATTLLSFQSFDICGRVGGVRKALKLLCTSQVSWLQVVPTEVWGIRSWKQQWPLPQPTDITVLLRAWLPRVSIAIFASPLPQTELWSPSHWAAVHRSR